MSFVRRLARLAAGATVSILLVATLSGCAKVYEIHAGPKPGPTINILFLGDGFDADQLQTYRAATYYLSEHLVEAEPFCHVADRLRFFRMDVYDPDGVEVASCNYARRRRPRIRSRSRRRPAPSGSSTGPRGSRLEPS